MRLRCLAAALPIGLLHACSFPEHTFDDAKFRGLGAAGSAGDSSSVGGVGGDGGDGVGGSASGTSALGGSGGSVDAGGASGSGGTPGVGGGGSAGTSGSGGAIGGHGGSAGGGGSGGSASGGSAGDTGQGGTAGSAGGDAGAGGSAGSAGSGGSSGASPGGSAGSSGAPGGNGGGGAGGGNGGGNGGGGTGAGNGGGGNGGSGAGGGGTGGQSGSSGSSGAGGGPTSPTVTAIDPADRSTDIPATSAITLTFSDTMLATSLVAQSADGPCTGTAQLSCDASGFVTCVGIASVVVNGTSVVLTPVGPLPSGEICETRITTGATSDTGVALAATYTSFGFAVVSSTGGGCSLPDVVISQLYGGGGNVGSKWKNDFIELFNRSNHAVKLDGWSVQYTSTMSIAWPSLTSLSGILQPGHYYLIQEAAGGMGTDPLPTPDAVGSITMSSTTAKVALVSSTASLSGACPSGGTVVDLVAYGTGSACTSMTSTLSNTSGTARKTGGCSDTGMPGTDFVSGPPTPRNSAVSAAVCSVCN